VIIQQERDEAMSELLKRVLQELPAVQKEAIHLAFRGISGREIANQKQDFFESRYDTASFGLADWG
jgi:hypothetical protein